jgi:hypothetical protein
MVPGNCRQLFGKGGVLEAVIYESSVTTRSIGNDLQNLDLDFKLNLDDCVCTLLHSFHHLYRYIRRPTSSDVIGVRMQLRVLIWM